MIIKLDPIQPDGTIDIQCVLEAPVEPGSPDVYNYSHPLSYLSTRGLTEDEIRGIQELTLATLNTTLPVIKNSKKSFPKQLEIARNSLSGPLEEIRRLKGEPPEDDDWKYGDIMT